MKEEAMEHHQKKAFHYLQIIIMILLFCSASITHIESAYGQLFFAACDINGDRTVDITDAILGLQVVTGIPVTDVKVPNGEEIDLQKIIYALQVHAGARESQAHLVDWDGDGFSEFTGDCDETDPNINPDQPEICNDEIDNNCDGEIDEGCHVTVATPAGEDVGISALDCDFLFDAVTAAGETTVDVLSSAPTQPAGFLWSGTYFDVSTTAEFTGPVQVCINYDDTGLSAEREAGLQIFHYNPGTSQWQNITTIPADTENNRVCG
ncbi:MAG: putative metal-binding motif-containing protein [Deltaproteobacteria bacterium]|nr:putative metal-binding motif-containing protein [Deltaproteobacteria bacterium]